MKRLAERLARTRAGEHRTGIDHCYALQWGSEFGALQIKATARAASRLAVQFRYHYRTTSEVLIRNRLFNTTEVWMKTLYEGKETFHPVS